MRKVAQTALGGEMEVTEQLTGQLAIPCGVEIAEVIQVVAERHPARHLLILGDVSDLRELRGTERAGVDTQHFRPAGGSAMNIHEQLDGRGLTGAIGSDEAGGSAMNIHEH